ncbi:MAG: 50S ribosomal protein L15 [Gammaproteobacteria bacterium]
MDLNTITPADQSKFSRKRVGRGIGSGFGKTCGRGHKGQKSRSGGYHKIYFEGGQMPLQRRLPKYGFTSRKALHVAEIRLHELARVAEDKITLESLRAAGIINTQITRAKIILSGKIEKAVHVLGIKTTPGAQQAIEAAGGKVEA